MELVDVVDSKSTASDGVPVRVRPPAPKRKTRICVSSFLVRSLPRRLRRLRAGIERERNP